MDQLAHLGAFPPLHLFHVGNLLQFQLRVQDDVLLLSPELLGSCGISTVGGEPQSKHSLRIVPSEVGRDAHHSEAQLERTEVVFESARDPQLGFLLCVLRVPLVEDLDVGRDQVPGHIDLNQRVEDPVESQEVHHFIYGFSCLVQVASSDGGQGIAMRGSGTENVVWK